MKKPPAGLRGRALVNSARWNKSTAFTEAEREAFGLTGLLPPRIETIDKHVQRSLESVRRKAFDIERYVYLMALLERNETLFYRLLIDHVDEMLPLVYTPTVGQACREFGNIFRATRGMYLCFSQRGKIGQILENWPERDVRVIVMTDGERILGLGDLGASGMGIPIGKLALYAGLAGIAPQQCLPILVDVGTDNEELRRNPLYLGVDQGRVRGDDYYAFMDEVVSELHGRFPKALIQFEDFLTPNAYRLLDTYRHQFLCFNDDIQGTAAVALAGVLASTRMTGKSFADLKIMFVGAGSAATGIADLMVARFESTGMTNQAARERLWFVDSKGLVVAGRDNLRSHNQPYAHDVAAIDLFEALETIQPDVLIGATGVPGIFSRAVIESMTRLNERPVVFALSNPTERAECTAEQCYQWSDGKAIFASGSPFDPVTIGGKTFHPGQGNNAYVFPGLGLGAIASEATQVSDAMLLRSAEVLAQQVNDEDLDLGRVYPAMARIREVSLKIAVAVAEQAQRDAMAGHIPSTGYERHISGLIFEPTYEDYLQ